MECSRTLRGETALVWEAGQGKGASSLTLLLPRGHMERGEVDRHGMRCLQTSLKSGETDCKVLRLLRGGKKVIFLDLSPDV